MKFSILSLFIQVCLTVTELVIKRKRVEGAVKSGWHVPFSFSCPSSAIAAGLLPGAASRIVLSCLAHPLQPLGLPFPGGMLQPSSAGSPYAERAGGLRAVPPAL